MSRFCKDPSETCGTIGPTEYLGHFANKKNLNRGHNSDGPATRYQPKSLLESPNPTVTKRFPFPTQEEERRNDAYEQGIKDFRDKSPDNPKRGRGVL